MRLILHIGAHKTGSTALQQFLFVNHEPLAARGFHYAASETTMKANAVAHALNSGEMGRVREFFTSHIGLARRKNAHTIVASAESFYGMALVPALCRKQSCPDVIDRDHVLMKRLFHALSDYELTTDIVCYLRRPDHFAESWYNQQVKYGSLFSGDFDAFLTSIYPALLYNQFMERWMDAFGRENCTVRIYECAAGGNIIRDFTTDVLSIDDLSSFKAARATANERLSRDLLEFKRVTNKGTTYEEMELDRKIFAVLSSSIPGAGADPDHYHAFLSPDERAELLADLADEMISLQSSFGLPPFPPFDAAAARASWRPYPGLTPVRQAALERQYGRTSKRLRFRLERALIKMRSGTHMTPELVGPGTFQKAHRLP